MDIQKSTETFYQVNPATGSEKSDAEYGISLMSGRCEGLYVSFKTNVGYGVHVCNDGAVVVHAARSGKTRYFAIEDLIRIALAEGLDPDLVGRC